MKTSTAELGKANKASPLELQSDLTIWSLDLTVSSASPRS